MRDEKILPAARTVAAVVLICTEVIAHLVGVNVVLGLVRLVWVSIIGAATAQRSLQPPVHSNLVVGVAKPKGGLAKHLGLLQHGVHDLLNAATLLLAVLLQGGAQKFVHLIALHGKRHTDMQGELSRVKLGGFVVAGCTYIELDIEIGGGGADGTSGAGFFDATQQCNNVVTAPFATQVTATSHDEPVVAVQQHQP